MKIMFYIGNLRKGGAERVVSVLSNEFAKEHEVIIMTTLNDKIEYNLNKRIKIVSLDDEKIKNVILRNLIYLRKIKKNVEKFNPDIILTFLLEPSYRILFLKNRIKCPVIVSDRNDPKIEYANLKNKMIMKFLYRRADGFVFQTKEAQNYFPEHIRAKSKIIFNPVDDDFFYTNYTYKNSKEIVNVGRLTEQKNQILLIRSFQKVLEKKPDFKLTIYGKGPLENELQEYIYKNNLNRSIKLSGTIDDVNKMLKDKYAFVLSSKYEGMPNALMEALAVGVPCISTDCPCGGSRELIINNYNGLLVENDNEAEMVKAILSLINDRKKCEKISSNSKKSMEQFTINNISKKWLQFMREVIGNEKNN